MTGSFKGLTQEEQILLQGCRAGDQEAWLALFRSYSPDIGRFLKGMLRQSSDIDDLVQQVLMNFLSSLDRFKGDSSLRTWLLGIARNVALREIRTTSRRNHYVKKYAESVERAQGNLEERLVARHELDHILHIIDGLDVPFREVWLLREMSGCSARDVADILEVEVATVRTRHFRARKQLMERLQKKSVKTSLRLVKGVEK